MHHKFTSAQCAGLASGNTAVVILNVNRRVGKCAKIAPTTLMPAVWDGVLHRVPRGLDSAFMREPL